MKIYLNSAKENWIVDRIRSEWYKLNKDVSTIYIYRSDIIWIISPWTWKSISINKLKQKKILCSIYHIDEEKFNDQELEDFVERDNYVDTYHVISEKTKKQIENLTKKPIVMTPFWINPKLFFQIQDKEKLRSEFNIDKNAFLIGSFQRDTEGKDLVSPKLSKGPDRFLEIIKHEAEVKKDLKVLLTGKRRQYIMDNLNQLNIPFYYFEMVNFEDLNKLYNCLDMYIVSSRFEGGPQSILECAITKTPIVSTDVGVASQILSKESIFKMENYKEAKANVEYAFEKVQSFILPEGMKMYEKIFKDIYEN